MGGMRALWVTVLQSHPLVNIPKGLRGASAIHGWMEWVMGISVTNPEEEDRAKYIRRAEFQGKESTAAAVYYRIAESSDHATVQLEQADKPGAPVAKRGSVSRIAPLPERERRDLQ